MSSTNNTEQPRTKIGDIIQLVSPTNKKFIFRINEGEQLHTHRGIIHHDSLIGLPSGCVVKSHTGSSFIMLHPTLYDLLLETKRNTQIMYPKDIGYIILKLGIGANQMVLEAGTGSGALTTALAWFCGEHGQVYSYDIREEMQNLARKNLSRLGLDQRVIFKLRNIGDGIEELNLDAIFFDLPNPYDYLSQVKNALIPGGVFGCILPTTPQVSKLLHAMHYHQFGFVEVCEILLRFYKPVPERLRPTDRMVAHTGYLVFARPIYIPNDEMGVFSPEVDNFQPE